MDYVYEVGTLTGNIGYAQADDCMCSDDCRKSWFNVNLTGTGFYLKPGVMCLLPLQ